MIKSNLDQYTTLSKKTTLSKEEKAVFDAIVVVSQAEGKVASLVTPFPAALTAANDVLATAQEALVMKPSTTV